MFPFWSLLPLQMLPPTDGDDNVMINCGRSRNDDINFWKGHRIIYVGSFSLSIIKKRTKLFPIFSTTYSICCARSVWARLAYIFAVHIIISYWHFSMRSMRWFMFERLTWKKIISWEQIIDERQRLYIFYGPSGSNNRGKFARKKKMKKKLGKIDRLRWHLKCSRFVCLSLSRAGM